MTLRFNLTGKARTKLAKAISQELNTEATYIKGKTHAYIIGDYTLDKEGILTGPDNWELAANLQDLHNFVPASADYTAEVEEEINAETATEAQETPTEAQEAPNADEAPTIEEPAPKAKRRGIMDIIVDELNEHAEDGATWTRLHSTPQMECGDGRWRNLDGTYASTTPTAPSDEVETIEPAETQEQPTDSGFGLTIEMPLDGFNPDKLDNLCKLVTAKEALLKAALGASDLPIQVTDTIRFPWFQQESTLTAEEVEAYATFISLLCETAKEKKRVTAKAGEMPDNPKYAFRCFLLSLGMIGKEYATSRKVLLSKLEGNSAWKDGSKAKAEAPAITEPSEVAEEA